MADRDREITGPELSTNPRPKTTLVDRPDSPEVLRAWRETDVRSALCRAVKEYIERLSISWAGGRLTKFTKVLTNWAEPEQVLDYPSAVVYTPSAGSYDTHGLTPLVTQSVDGVALSAVAAFEQSITVELYSTDPNERMAIVAMLEDAFDPVDWMTGFRLEMPHYHSARATFEKTSLQYVDAAQDANRRIRIAQFTLQATCTQYVVLTRPFAKPKFRLDVDGTESAS